jgi:hypothetical protein
VSNRNAFPEILPPICGAEHRIASVVAETRNHPPRSSPAKLDWARIESAFAIALHMHQPLVPAGGVQAMVASPSDEQRYNAGVYRWCYERMGEFIPQLIADGKEPRVMFDYSGELLWGFEQMGLGDVIEKLRHVTCDPRYLGAVEWLGTTWGHAVAPSTPVQDYRLHVLAWQQHFAALFGDEAFARVKGFSPTEMALPNHPDVAYEFVKTLKDCGYRWVLVHEHSVEGPDTGRGPELKQLPHRLLCRNSAGEEAQIIAIIKTQGSDTKLVAQMQPYYEARGLFRCDLAGRKVAPLVTQIADGENGGVMMNEFPAKYMEVVRECSGTRTSIANVSEYLDNLLTLGVTEAEMPAVQPIGQTGIWQRFRPGEGTDKLANVIKQLEREDSRFHMEGGSWTNNVSWIRGYENLLGPMEQLSSLFFEKVIKPGISPRETRYRNALFHLLVSQTSCYRYWGQGLFVDYGREICRRGIEILSHDF